MKIMRIIFIAATIAAANAACAGTGWANCPCSDTNRPTNWDTAATTANCACDSSYWCPTLTSGAVDSITGKGRTGVSCVWGTCTNGGLVPSRKTAGKWDVSSTTEQAIAVKYAAEYEANDRGLLKYPASVCNAYRGGSKFTGTTGGPTCPGTGATSGTCATASTAAAAATSGDACMWQSSKHGSHTPSATVNSTTCKIEGTQSHNGGDLHWIDAWWLTDATAGANSAILEWHWVGNAVTTGSKITFNQPAAATTSVRVHSHCNLHGSWHATADLLTPACTPTSTSSASIPALMAATLAGVALIV